MSLPHTTRTDHVVATPRPPGAATSLPLLSRLHLRHSHDPGGVAHLAAVADNVGQFRRGWCTANRIRNRDSLGRSGATGAAGSAADARRRAPGEHSSVSTPARTAVVLAPRTPVHNGRDGDETVLMARPPPKPRPLPLPPPPRRDTTRSRGCCRHWHPCATMGAACTTAFCLLPGMGSPCKTVSRAVVAAVRAKRSGPAVQRPAPPTRPDSQPHHPGLCPRPLEYPPPLGSTPAPWMSLPPWSTPPPWHPPHALGGVSVPTTTTAVATTVADPPGGRSSSEARRIPAVRVILRPGRPLWLPLWRLLRPPRRRLFPSGGP